MDVLRIHGSLLAIGELVLTLAEEDINKDHEFFEVQSTFFITDKKIQFCLDELPSYTKKSVHANLVTVSSLQFVQCICHAILPISPLTMESYLTLVESALQKNIEALQQAASEALG